jgi:hypothetical protein
MGGLAITIGTALVPFDELLTPASGQTTSPASSPNDTLAGYAQSVELALAQAYQAGATTAKLATPDFAAAVSAFATHHEAHAAAFGALAGASATGKPNPKLLDVITGQMHGAGTESAVLEVVYDLEIAATSTDLYLLSLLTDPGKVEVTASVLPVESQHATVVGLLLGKDPNSVTDFLPSFVIQDQALLPKTYPNPTA